MAAQLQSVNNGVYITNLNDPIDFRGTGFGVLEGKCGCQVDSTQYEFTVNTWTDELITATPPVDLPSGSFVLFWVAVAGEPLPIVALLEGDGGILATRGDVDQLVINAPSEITAGGLYSVKLMSLPGAKPGNGTTEIANPDGEMLVIPGVPGAQPGDATYLFRSARTRNVYTHRPGEWVGGVEENGPLWALLYGNNNLPQVKTDIGEGSQTNSGTLKLSNSVAGTQGVNDGVAATPAAVKSTYDYVTAQIASTVKLGGDQYIAGVKNFAVSPELDGEDMFASGTWTPSLGSTYGVSITPGLGATYVGDIETVLNTVHANFTVDLSDPAAAPTVGDVIILTGLSVPPDDTSQGIRGAGSAWLAWQEDAVSDGEFAIFNVAVDDVGGVYLTCMQVNGPINFAARLAGHFTYRKA